MNAGIALLVASAVAHLAQDSPVPLPPPPLTNRIHILAVVGPPAPRLVNAPALPPGAQDYVWTLQQSFDSGNTWGDMLVNLCPPTQGTWPISDSVTGRVVELRYVRQKGWK